MDQTLPIPATRSTGPRAATAGRAPTSRPDKRLEISLLGRVELSVDGHEIQLAARGAQALVAVLALKPESARARRSPPRSGPMARVRDIGFAPPGAVARAVVLRGGGGPLDRYLTIDAEVIGFQPCAPVELDVARFERGPARSGSLPEEAIAMYRGDLVECLGLECFAVDRERLSDAYEDALARWRSAASGRRVRGARDAAEQLLARDPLREEAHATLLRVYGRIGSRAQVLRQYRRLSRLLRTELGVEPLPETEAAFRSAMVEPSSGRGSGRRRSPRRGSVGASGPRREGGLIPASTHRSRSGTPRLRSRRARNPALGPSVSYVADSATCPRQCPDPRSLLAVLVSLLAACSASFRARAARPRPPRPRPPRARPRLARRTC